MTTRNGRLEQAWCNVPQARLQSLCPVADGEALTMTDPWGRLSALVEALRV